MLATIFINLTTTCHEVISELCLFLMANKFLFSRLKDSQKIELVMQVYCPGFNSQVPYNGRRRELILSSGLYTNHDMYAHTYRSHTLNLIT